MVTGVSTGALIAPFAFLGPDYDAALREVYTTMTPDRIFRRRGLTAALFDDAMADTTPLAEVIAKYADQKMFDAIAPRIRQGPPAADRHHRSRRPAAGDLEHRRAGGQRPSQGARPLPQDPAGVGGDPRRLRAGADRCRDRRPASTRRCTSTAAPSPSSSSIRRPSRSARSASSASAHRLHHPQRPARSRSCPDRAADDQHRRPRHRHHAGGQRPERRAAHLLRLARDGVDYNLAYIGADFTADEARRVRPGLHAGAVRVRLPRGQGRPSLAQGAAGAQGGEGPATPLSQRAISRTGVRSDCTSASVRGPRNLVSPLAQRGAQHDQVVATASCDAPDLGLGPGVGRGQALDGHAAALAQAMRLDQHRHAEPARAAAQQQRVLARIEDVQRRQACRGWRRRASARSRWRAARRRCRRSAPGC